MRTHWVARFDVHDRVHANGGMPGRHARLFGGLAACLSAKIFADQTDENWNKQT
jgi:hypothetical protein